MSDSKSCSFSIIFSCLSLNRKHTHGGQTSTVKRTKVIYSFPYVLLHFAGRDPRAGRRSLFLVSCKSLIVRDSMASGLLTPKTSLPLLITCTLCQGGHWGKVIDDTSHRFGSALKALRNRHTWKVITVLLPT